MKRTLTLLVCAGAISIISMVPRKKDPAQLEAAKADIGNELFFDKSLSNPDGQACTVCHAPKTALSDPNHEAVTEGMLDGFFVNRNSQSLAYVSFVPPLTKDAQTGTYHGGLFWDGRSSSLEHQLSGPFFNIAEMNNEDTAMVANAIRNAPYYKQMKKVYGKAKNDTELFNQAIDAIARFERTSFFNEFSSKFDYMLAGKVSFTETEQKGYDLFKGKANCVQCHSMEPKGPEQRILFTDYSYHNLGLPRNETNPFYTTDSRVNPKGKDAIDLGLGAVVKDPAQNGKFRTPTLRNLQYTGPYFHHGGVKTLREAIHFIAYHNQEDLGIPEVPENIENKFTGQLALSEEEEDALYQFLLTLSDGYQLPQ